MKNTNARLALALALALCSIPAVAGADTKADLEWEAGMEIKDLQRWLLTLNTNPTPDDLADYSTGAGDDLMDRGKRCLAKIDAALKAGVDPEKEVRHHGEGSTKLADGKKYCQAIIDYGVAVDKIMDERAAEYRQVAAKYEAHGIKGERLALFVEYDNVYFYGKGCGYYIEDIAVLAKAKVLFHWLENSDGTHTIRKYQFKGNKLKKVTDKLYMTSAKAQRGCK